LWVFRKNIKRVLLTIGLIFLTVVLIKGPVMNTAGIEQPDFVESLCVPLQQVARVLVDGKELTASEKELIDNVIDTTYIKELYAADFADNIKELVRAGNPEYLESHKFEYFKLWAGLGLRYPGVYVMAWTDLTKGFWYPDVESEVAMIDGIMANDYGLVASPILRGKIVVKAKEIFLKLGNMIPLYGLLWSAGTYLWILCICLMVIGNSAYKGDRGKDMILMIPFIGIELTLFIATPVTDFRYVYSIVLAIPLIISVVTRGISDKAPEK
ncbi:MAG: DUF6020 family protein, partial [Butyrivibrio sp.]|nr:DUF6020 family protein [Butyrivibrio sp.]